MTPLINLVDPSSYERDGIPHDQFAWLREHAPVYWHADGGGNGSWPGFWAITRHRDIECVSREPKVFSSHRRLAIFDELPEDDIALQRLMMLNMDPPAHTHQRSFVNRGFTPRVIGRLEHHIQEICDELVDRAVARGEADFVHDIAAPLPLYVICELIGAPPHDRDRLFRLSNQLIGYDDPEFQGTGGDSALAAAEMYAFADRLAAQRRDDPRDDIVTRLLRPGDHGEQLTAHEFDMFILLLTVAGNETTRNAASAGMLAFFEHPGQWARLCADPGLAGSAAEEIVRWASPVNLFRRTASRDTEICGQRIAEGDKVVVFYSSANRDASVFADPFVFDIGRTPNPHLGFGGGGPHFCLGRHLAALELRVLFATLARRMPGIELAGKPRRLRSNFVNGIKEMPVRCPPTRRPG